MSRSGVHSSRSSNLPPAQNERRPFSSSRAERPSFSRTKSPPSSRACAWLGCGGSSVQLSSTNGPPATIRTRMTPGPYGSTKTRSPSREKNRLAPSFFLTKPPPFSPFHHINPPPISQVFLPRKLRRARRASRPPGVGLTFVRTAPAAGTPRIAASGLTFVRNGSYSAREKSLFSNTHGPGVRDERALCCAQPRPQGAAPPSRGSPALKRQKNNARYSAASQIPGVILFLWEIRTFNLGEKEQAPVGRGPFLLPVLSRRTPGPGVLHHGCDAGAIMSVFLREKADVRRPEARRKNQITSGRSSSTRMRGVKSSKICALLVGVMPQTSPLRVTRYRRSRCS